MLHMNRNGELSEDINHVIKPINTYKIDTTKELIPK